MTLMLIKCGRTSSRIWENKGCIFAIDIYGWFQEYFRYWFYRNYLDNRRQISKWKRIVGRFRGKLVKMIKDINCRFDDDSISPKLRQMLLHWGYEFVENDLWWFMFFLLHNFIIKIIFVYISF